jgi:Kef-type K+ transport system membrane component KefB
VGLAKVLYPHLSCSLHFCNQWTTEKLGLHALFGAFVAEVLPQNDRFLIDLVDRIESLSLALLLPLFFALTGLRTRVDLLTGRSALVYGVAIIAIAAAGKLAGGAFAARIVGADRKDSVALGV